MNNYKVNQYKVTTPRGTFKISYEFPTMKEAKSKGFGYYFTNDDGREILTRHIDFYHIEVATLKKKERREN